MFCKTIILSNSENLNSNAPKGILTLSNENNSIKGKIRLYNIIALPFGTKIGLYINEKVYISPLNKKPNHYEFDLQSKIDITQSIYCALIDNSLGDKKVLLEGGSFNGFYFTDSPFDAVLEAKDEQLEKTIDTALKQVEKCEDCSQCSKCEYKKYFYQTYSNVEKNDNLNENPQLEPTNLLEQENDLNEQNHDNLIDSQPYNEINLTKQEDCLDNNLNKSKYTLDNENLTKNETHISLDKKDGIDEKTNFLNDIIYQLDEMLTKYPADEVLNSIIPDSRFVCVDCDSTYVIGVIYENKNLKYIAYGVPAKYNSLPPADLGQHYQWLPLNPNDPMSDGYFMLYQDALDGTIVEINFEE